MSKTYRELAVQFGVTKQAISKRISKMSDTKKHITLNGKTKLVDTALEKRLATHFKGTTAWQSSESSTNQSTSDSSNNGNVDSNSTGDVTSNVQVKLMQSVIETLQQQLLEKDKQIASKDDQIRDLHKLMLVDKQGYQPLLNVGGNGSNVASNDNSDVTSDVSSKDDGTGNGNKQQSDHTSGTQHHSNWLSRLFGR